MCSRKDDYVYYVYVYMNVCSCHCVFVCLHLPAFFVIRVCLCVIEADIIMFMSCEGRLSLTHLVSRCAVCSSFDKFISGTATNLYLELMLQLYESSSTRGIGKTPARLHHPRCVAWRRFGNTNYRLRNYVAEIIANITQLDSSYYSYINYSEMSSFAHDSATMSLECHSRQALGEDIRRLIFTCDLIKVHLRLIT